MRPLLRLQWSLAVTDSPGDPAHHLVMMKGAPEIVLTKCSHHLKVSACLGRAFPGAHVRCCWASRCHGVPNACLQSDVCFNMVVVWFATSAP